MIVADTNLVAYLLIDGERTEVARQVHAADSQWHLPPLWRSEFLNVLAVSVRAQVLTREQALTVWRNATGIFGRFEKEPGGEAVLEAALEHGISGYDAQFVVVARELGTKLVTGDLRLAEACPEVAVGMEAFVAAGAG